MYSIGIAKGNRALQSAVGIQASVVSQRPNHPHINQTVNSNAKPGQLMFDELSWAALSAPIAALDRVLDGWRARTTKLFGCSSP